eukprot:scaffold1171_cov177-Amphora_coffeaeformis.AAC.21
MTCGGGGGGSAGVWAKHYVLPSATPAERVHTLLYYVTTSWLLCVYPNIENSFYPFRCLTCCVLVFLCRLVLGFQPVGAIPVVFRVYLVLEH